MPPLSQNYHTTVDATSIAILITIILVIVCVVVAILGIVLSVTKKRRMNKQTTDIKNDSLSESHESNIPHLTADEWQLVADFRALGASGKQLIKTTMKTLLDTSSSESG